jgi:hypothetical protein
MFREALIISRLELVWVLLWHGFHFVPVDAGRKQEKEKQDPSLIWDESWFYFLYQVENIRLSNRLWINPFPRAGPF